MKGGSLKPQELNDFLQASYEENAPKTMDNYILDDKLSNLYGKVYVNESLRPRLQINSKISNGFKNV